MNIRLSYYNSDDCAGYAVFPGGGGNRVGVYDGTGQLLAESVVQAAHPDTNTGGVMCVADLIVVEDVPDAVSYTIKVGKSEIDVTAKDARDGVDLMLSP